MNSLQSFFEYIADYKTELDKKGRSYVDRCYRMTDDELYDLVKAAQISREAGRSVTPVHWVFGCIDYTKIDKKTCLEMAKLALKKEPLYVFGVHIIPDKPLYTRGRYPGI